MDYDQKLADIEKRIDTLNDRIDPVMNEIKGIKETLSKTDDKDEKRALRQKWDELDAKKNQLKSDRYVLFAARQEVQNAKPATANV